MYFFGGGGGGGVRMKNMQTDVSLNNKSRKYKAILISASFMRHLDPHS